MCVVHVFAKLLTDIASQFCCTCSVARLRIFCGAPLPIHMCVPQANIDGFRHRLSLGNLHLYAPSSVQFFFWSSRSFVKLEHSKYSYNFFSNFQSVTFLCPLQKVFCRTSLLLSLLLCDSRICIFVCNGRKSFYYIRSLGNWQLA